MSDAVKTEYLIAYDYGGGGLWGVILARSTGEITAVYPELSVVVNRPVWMTDERYRELASTPYDIDGAPWGLLNALLADRARD